ncbi:MAG: type VI secretion system protein TssA [Pseudodonghicola sp.]|nr:type VI secretion system protein TssA [Pseudodonghicola sp.]
MELAVLLQSKGDDSPSGENLEYDPVFTEMELAAQQGEEVQIGDEIHAAEDPDYGEVRKKSLEVLERSHDLRAAVFLADALLHGDDGLNGFAEATGFIRGCLEDFWDSCHPELDEDDGDPTMRINAVQDLCGQPGGMGGPSPVYRSLRRVALTDSRGFGRFALRDIEIAEGLMTAPTDMTTIPDTASIGAAFQDTADEVLTGWLEAAQRGEENIRAISDVFSEQTPGQGPDLDPLIKLMHQIVKRLSDHASTSDSAAGEETAGDEVLGSMAAGNGGGGGLVVGGINSPADVSNALDRIVDYYKRNEPSSPVPLLLVRAKRLVNADFLTIMQDMAPAGIDNVHLIGGIEDDD